MEIWVDADACPVAIKEILFRAAVRTGIRLTLVANQSIQVPKSPLIRMIRVPSGFDVADKEIVDRCSAGDLVVTNDIPLAAEVIEKGCYALSASMEKGAIMDDFAMVGYIDTDKNGSLENEKQRLIKMSDFAKTHKVIPNPESGGEWTLDLL